MNPTPSQIFEGGYEEHELGIYSRKGAKAAKKNALRGVHGLQLCHAERSEASAFALLEFKQILRRYSPQNDNQE